MALLIVFLSFCCNYVWNVKEAEDGQKVTFTCVCVLLLFIIVLISCLGGAG